MVPLSTFCYIPCGTTLHILLHSLWYHSPHSATFPVVPLSTFCYIPCGTTLHILLHSLWYHSLLHSLWYHSPHSATFPVVPLSTFCYIPCGTTLHIHHSIPYHDLFQAVDSYNKLISLSVKSCLSLLTFAWKCCESFALKYFQ